MNIKTSLAVALVVGTVAVAHAAGPQGPPTAPSQSPAASPQTSPTRGAAPATGSVTTTRAIMAQPPGDYVIGPGDVLTVSVWQKEALSRTVPVRPDGKISLPLLHDIQAAGLTAMQLREKLTTALAEFLATPEVAVMIAEVHNFRVSVIGEVLKPGVYEFRNGNASVLEALAMAGGFSPFASPSKISVIRKDGEGQTKKVKFNYNRAVTSSGDEENLSLQPGDVVVVP